MCTYKQTCTQCRSTDTTAWTEAWLTLFGDEERHSLVLCRTCGHVDDRTGTRAPTNTTVDGGAE